MSRNNNTKKRKVFKSVCSHSLAKLDTSRETTVQTSTNLLSQHPPRRFSWNFPGTFPARFPGIFPQILTLRSLATSSFRRWMSRHRLRALSSCGSLTPIADAACFAARKARQLHDGYTTVTHTPIGDAACFTAR